MEGLTCEMYRNMCMCALCIDVHVCIMHRYVHVCVDMCYA